MEEYWQKTENCMLCDYSALESKAGVRTVLENSSFIAVCPYWGVWPYETLVLPKSHISKLDQLTTTQTNNLADILSRLTCRYDNLFHTSFPYSMGIHQAPLHFPEDRMKYCCLHIHFYPPLLRSATVKKFLVGWVLQTLLLTNQVWTLIDAAERYHSRASDWEVGKTFGLAL